MDRNADRNRGNLANAAARLQAKSARRKALPTLWLLTDAVRLPDPSAAIAHLPRGSGVILRHTDAKARQALAWKIRPLCRARGLVCLIALDWRLAAAVGADGVHLPERGAAAGALLWRRQRKGLMTMAAHSARAIERATRLGADAIILAPVFATASHPSARTLGPLRFAALTRATSQPVIALGGITDSTVARLAQARVHGFAAIGGLART